MKKAKVFVRTPFNYDGDVVSLETGLRCDDISKAQQHQKDDADINVIVKRFGLTGQLPTNVRMPQYGDFTGVVDYQSALNAVLEAERSFMSMSPDVRSRFHNNPAEFVEFCSDEKNYDEALKLGLVNPRKTALPPQPTGEDGKAVTPPPAAKEAVQGSTAS